MIEAIVAGTVFAGALGMVVWLVHGRIAAADARVAEREAHGETRIELERTRFELATARTARDAAHARASALEEFIADDVNASPNPDLGRTDIRSRVVRFAQRWNQADRDRALSGSRAETVPEGPATDEADDPTVPHVRPVP